MKEIKISTEYITLSQFLKISSIASSGGEAKYLVKELDIYVDGIKEDRRGRKLYKGMTVEVKKYGVYKIS